MQESDFSCVCSSDRYLGFKPVISLAYEKRIEELRLPVHILEKLKSLGIFRIKDLTENVLSSYFSGFEKEMLTAKYRLFYLRNPLNVSVFENKILFELIKSDLELCLIDSGFQLILNYVENDQLTVECKNIAKMFASSANGIDMQRWLHNFFEQTYERIVKDWVNHKNGFASELEITEWVDSCSQCKNVNIKIIKMLSLIFDWPKFFWSKYMLGFSCGSFRFYSNSEENINKIKKILYVLSDCFYSNEHAYDFLYVLKILKNNGLLDNIDKPDIFLLRILSFNDQYKIVRSHGSVLVQKYMVNN